MRSVTYNLSESSNLLLEDNRSFSDGELVVHGGGGFETSILHLVESGRSSSELGSHGVRGQLGELFN